MFDMEKYKNYPDICLDGMKFLKKHPEYDCPDQDILNYYFADKYYHLPVKYDTFIDAIRLPDIKQNELQKCIEFLEQNKEEKPLLLIMSAYPLINQILIQKGYKEGIDYLDINNLLIHDRINDRELLKMIKV